MGKKIGKKLFLLCFIVCFLFTGYFCLGCSGTEKAIEKVYKVGSTIQIEPIDFGSRAIVEYYYIDPNGSIHRIDSDDMSFDCEIEGKYIVRVYAHDKDYEQTILQDTICYAVAK